MRAPLTLFTATMLAPLPLAAQVAPATPPPAAAADDNSEIVVTAERLSGAVATDLPPVIELDEKAVESYGATSITELLTALAPQTGGGRGRGAGGPVVLLNGMRISGFQEIRDLPPEAIRRVQVLPEEAALQYGFSPDQRVVNFILKDDFRAITLDAEGGVSTRGNYRSSELQVRAVRITKSGRVNLSVQRNATSSVFEADRSIVQRTGLPAGSGSYRTLAPYARQWALNATVNRKLSDRLGLTLNGTYETDDRDAQLGIATPLVGPLTTPFVALDRLTRNDTLHGGLTLTRNAPWTSTLTAGYDHAIVNTATDRTLTTTDTARSQRDTANAILTMSGGLFDLPAGKVRTTLRAGLSSDRLASQTLRSVTPVTNRLARDVGDGRVTIELPIASRARDVLPFLGKLSLNANVAYRRLSDFGGLTSYGYGLNWQPVEGLTFIASAIDNQVEPGISDLGNPVIVTPGVSIYDFTRGQAVLVNQTTGGNPALQVERQRDTKFSLAWTPAKPAGLSINVDYFRNRSSNPVAGFPILTPEIEAAFPGRVTRDASGALTAVDTRSVNYARTSSDVVRVGFTFQKSFGQPAGRGGGGGFGGGRSPGGGGFGGGPGGGRMGGVGAGSGDGGRWTVALYDSIRFTDRILIRPGLAELNLLGGDATGNGGGAPRHSFDLDAGWFNKDLGFRINGSYASGSVVNGSNAASTLRFGDLATLNFNAFYNFDSNKSLVERVPFLKGVRVRFQVANITDAIREVRDGQGLVPLSYQAGYLDPRGRTIEIDFRKRF